jgi:hypothetical protein
MLPLTIVTPLFVTPLLADGPAPPAPSHIRPLSADARDLVASGVDRSESIRTLVDHLEASDLVVYIRLRWFMTDRNGQLIFVSSAGSLRYVIIEIACGRIVPDQLATLGHELRHAVEVADAAAVVSRASFARHYARIGIDLGGAGLSRQYETDAAVEAGETVRRELMAPVATSR